MLQGYDYKNTIANGIFFNLGARLARYTQNDSYAEWAVKTYDWIAERGYIDEDWNVYDGAHIGDDNCSSVVKVQFSYNAAVILQGAAFMYNYVRGELAKGKAPVISRGRVLIFPIIIRPPVRSERYGATGLPASSTARSKYSSPMVPHWNSHASGPMPCTAIRTSDPSRVTCTDG